MVSSGNLEDVAKIRKPIPRILEILLKDRLTGKNILWVTDYKSLGLLWEKKWII